MVANGGLPAGLLGQFMVPEEGLEPSRTCVRQILSLLKVARLLGIDNLRVIFR